MFAFLTGSRVYGTPKPSSDVDLVIRVDTETASRLRLLADKKMEVQQAGEKRPVRFGNLNLILCESDEEYAVWRLGTSRMKIDHTKGSSFSRDDAKSVFDVYRDDVGITDKADSGDKK